MNHRLSIFIGAACGSALLNQMFRTQFEEHIKKVLPDISEDLGKANSPEFCDWLLDKAVKQFETAKKTFDGFTNDNHRNPMLYFEIPRIRSRPAKGLGEDCILFPK